MNGSPLLVSGVVVYYYRDTRRAALDMLNRDVFVRDQASAVLKQIVGGFPYENLHVESDSEGDEADAPLTPCLKDDAKVGLLFLPQPKWIFGLILVLRLSMMNLLLNSKGELLLLVHKLIHSD